VTGGGVNIIPKFQLSRSNALGVMMFRRSGQKRIADLPIELINDKCVFGTALATPGLLQTPFHYFFT